MRRPLGMPIVIVIVTDRSEIFHLKGNYKEK